MRIPLPKVKGFHQHARDVQAAQLEWPDATAVQKTIPRKKSSSGGKRCGKNSICRMTSMKAPSQKDGMTRGVIVRQTPRMESGQERSVPLREKSS